MAEELKVQPDAPEGDSQEYIDNMVAKAEGQQPTAEPQQSQEVDTQDDLILGKFKTQEDLVKSYQELEKKLGDTNKVEKLQADQPQPEGQPAGFNFESAEQEFNETGNLSDNTIKSLEEQGLSRQYIDTYMKGLNAMADQFEQKAFEATGGEENYKAMQDWVGNSLTPEEVTLFNNGVSGDDQSALFTIRNMYARFQSETKEPNINLGETNVSGQGTTYDSLAQMKADMKDPRYGTDPAFRKQVQEKIARSKVI